MHDLIAKMDYQCEGAPDAAMFALWRAVLSLVHVDDEVDDLEDYFVQSVTQIFKFSEEQKAQVDADMTAQADPRALFKAIEGQAHRAQFFRLARIVVWCDGVLHDDEMEIVNGIRDDLGAEAALYESELRWMDRRPDLPLGERASIPEEAMIKNMIYQMIAFYKELGETRA